MSMVAAVLTAATAIVSCKDDIQTTGKIDLSAVPTQVVYDISALQSNNGELSYRMLAPKMERYENAESPYEIFPDGFEVMGYTEDGLLETRLLSDKARHTTVEKEEKWEAYGNVVITNYIEGQVLKTDTLYWDRNKKEIFTHCFVRMSSPQGYMQGYGMVSDEMVRDVTVLKPFDSYTYVENDSTGRKYVDTVNFVGPILK